ncbi:MAG: MotA/TolQ/ExbB proton channel family protein [Candidatus Kapabacteria bacterium]|nr:MotA/TolQ/ExbB proton channel family protein [Candidatus Kapabacteria bacterium]
MKGSTFIGIIIGAVAIFGAFVWESGSITSVSNLIMLPAMIIVFGGTFAAALAGSSFQQMLRIPNLIRLAIYPKNYDMEELMEQIVFLASVVRLHGILALDKYLAELKHPFLRKLFEVCIDGAEPEMLNHVSQTEVYHISERHSTNISIFVKMGGFSPTMGIIGTVMGLISTLAAAGSDPNVLIHHIASAFIATMWGIFMANVVWLPIGDKLRTLHNSELQVLQFIHDGVHAVLLGENPTVIKARLASAFPLSKQAAIMEKPMRVVKKEPGSPDIIH